MFLIHCVYGCDYITLIELITDLLHTIIVLYYFFQIYNWAPEYYDDVSTLPEEMPADLKEYITKLPPSSVCTLSSIASL